jgi:signal transduction histidine kinase
VLALLTVPVAMIAFEFGWRGGLVATAVAFGAVLAWGQIRTLGYVSRGTTFLATALVVGIFADWLRAAQAEATRHQRRADDLARNRLEEERTAAAERARIAREFHDVIAHSVSVMTVQAAAARRVLDRDPEHARDAIEAVELTGREALDEMRRLVALLRPGGDGEEFVPPQGLAQLEGLVAQMRTMGLDVHLHVEGEPMPLAAGLDLSAYRIAQEALTNVLKHAGPGPAEVMLRYTGSALEIVVSNALAGGVAAAARKDGLGHGLIGMRERVTMLGGELSAGPNGAGRYELHARLPFPVS